MSRCHPLRIPISNSLHLSPFLPYPFFSSLPLSYHITLKKNPRPFFLFIRLPSLISPFLPSLSIFSVITQQVTTYNGCVEGGGNPEIRISCKLQSRKGGSWSWKWSMSYMHTDIPQGQKLGAPNIHILSDRLCSHHSCSEQEAGKFYLLTPTYTTASLASGKNNPPFPFPSLLH